MTVLYTQITNTANGTPRFLLHIPAMTGDINQDLDIIKAGAKLNNIRLCTDSQRLYIRGTKDEYINFIYIICCSDIDKIINNIQKMIDSYNK